MSALSFDLFRGQFSVRSLVGERSPLGMASCSPPTALSAVYTYQTLSTNYKKSQFVLFGFLFVFGCFSFLGKASSKTPRKRLYKKSMSHVESRKPKADHKKIGRNFNASFPRFACLNRGRVFFSG
jgi:hypothetical protein